MISERVNEFNFYKAITLKLKKVILILQSDLKEFTNNFLKNTSVVVHFG